MTETVAVIDYGSGNLRSAAKAFSRAAAGTDAQILVTDDPLLVRQADRIVLPGVGAFADCMTGLTSVPGLHEVLEERVIGVGTPFFGICVGMQLMANIGREKGEYRGLGWIEGAIEKIAPTDPALKVPHMGWNTLTPGAPHALFEGIPLAADGWHAYFVHSYHFRAADPQTVLASADYGGPLTAAIGRDNMFGTQFHPEKSQKLGLALIENFLRWRP